MSQSAPIPNVFAGALIAKVGNSQPFRVRIVNQFNDNYDYFYVKRADASCVYGLELEHVLQQHPDVAAVAVVGIPDPEFGQRLKAVVVPKGDAPSDEAALRAWLKPRVARYQMPAVVEFRAELPYSALGKLNRRALTG